MRRPHLTRRSRWLESRRSMQRDRPVPVRVMAVNFASVSESPARVRQIVAETQEKARAYDVAVIVGCEAGDVEKARFGPAWQVFHDERPKDGPRAGTLLAVDTSRVQMHGEILTQGCDAGAGIRSRYIAHAHLLFDPGTPVRWVATVGAFHAPPMRSWVKWAGYMSRLARLNLDVSGGDANKLQWATARALRRRVHTDRHVMAIPVARWIPSRRVAIVDVGSDHGAVITELWPNRKPSHRKGENRP